MKKSILLLIFILFFSLTGCKKKEPPKKDEPSNNPPIIYPGNDTPEEDPDPIISLNKEFYVTGEDIIIESSNYKINELDFAFDDDFSVKEKEKNIFTARRAGTYTLTATSIFDETKFASVELTIYSSSFELDATTDKVPVGGLINVWIYNFDNLYEKNEDDFIYTVNNDNVSIEDHTITAKKVGTFTVTATSKKNPLVTSSITLNVCDETKEFMILPTTTLGTIGVGDLLPLNVTLGYGPDELTWLCSNTEIVRVTKYDTAFEITGIGEGVTNISCYVKSKPQIKATYKITVKGISDVDLIDRLIQTAYKEVGTVEDGNNHQKYGVWYNNDGQPWCATFVSWCWYHSGLSNDLLLKYQGCQAGMDWCIEHKIFKYKESYTPKAGDIVFFLSSGMSHTGIVAYCDGAYIYTIEGNRSNKVGIWRIKCSDPTITGYGVPNYPTCSKRVDQSWIATQNTNGVYLWKDTKTGQSTL